MAAAVPELSDHFRFGLPAADDTLRSGSGAGGCQSVPLSGNSYSSSDRKAAALVPLVLLPELAVCCFELRHTGGSVYNESIPVFPVLNIRSKRLNKRRSPIPICAKKTHTWRKI